MYLIFSARFLIKTGAPSLTKIVRNVCNQFPFSSSNCYKLYFDQMHNNKDMYLHRELFVYIMSYIKMNKKNVGLKELRTH